MKKILLTLQGLVLFYSQLTILKPETLKSLYTPIGTIDYSLGNFGYVPYGQSLTVILKLADPHEGCSLVPLNQSDQETTQQVAVLVKRGNCTFAQKAYQAEKAGYNLIIISDIVDEDVNKVEMINKQENQQVNIPTVMISQRDGDKMRSFIYSNPSNQDVIINIKFATAKISEIVDYQYWLSSLDLGSYSFIEQFRPFHKQMVASLNFTPQYTLWQCQYCKTLNWKVNNDNCISGGRYCALDTVSLSGKDGMIEDLRQICIFKNYPVIWWDYMTEFGKTCLKFSNLNTPKDTHNCAVKLQMKLIPENKTITDCMVNSFVGGEKADFNMADNKIFEEQRRYQLAEGIHSYPVLKVNGQLYRGSLSLPLRNQSNNKTMFDTAHYGPLQMICQAFEYKFMPKICKERMRMYIGETGELKSSNDSTWVTWLIWSLSIFGLVILMFISICCYRRHMRKTMQQELSLQVNMAISQYFSLNEQSKTQK